MLGYSYPLDFRKYPVLLVILTCVCSWFSGLDVGAILGAREHLSNPTGPVMYSIVCLFVLALLFSFMLIRFVRRQPDSISGRPAS